MNKAFISLLIILSSYVGFSSSFAQQKSGAAAKSAQPLKTAPAATATALKAGASQKPGNGLNNASLNHLQDSLLKVSNRLFEAASNDERYEQNAKFIKTLVNALKTPNSFNYGFDSLKGISIVKSPDQSFRIFSWYVPTTEGTYRFFGTVQMATADGSLKLYPLLDDTEHITDNNQLCSNKAWYGARYYEILPLEVKGTKTAYILLGWKGNSNKTSKKVIEVLSFDKEGLQFGKPVFQDKKDEPAKNRIVFEYNKLNSMTLRYDRNEKMIVFDHLAPYDPNMAGNFEYYASDSSFDGYRQLGAKWKLVENIELKNDPNDLDGLYIDPKQKDIPSVKKF